MSMLNGFVVGAVAMALVMGMCAAIGTMILTHADNLPSLYAGIAAGVIAVLAVVGYVA